MAVLGACGDDSGGTPTDGPGSGSAIDAASPDAAVDPIVAPPANTWTYFETAGTQCIDGTPAGFSINYNPDSTKLMIYYEGGGACFNSFCDAIFSASGHTPTTGGIFDRTNAANPVKDWSWVYVPYCSGDIYGGNSDKMVGGKLRHFHGYTNTSTFLARLAPFFHTVDQVLLTGSSAGGFGAAVSFTQTQSAFGSTPVTLIDDSGPPFTSAVFPPCLQTLWRDTWNFQGTILAECGAACADDTNFVRDYFDHVRSTHTGLHAGLFSSTQDQTIRLFAGYGWTNGYNMCGDTPTAVDGATYTTGLLDIRSHGMSQGDGLSTYYITGSSHTILRSGNYYTTTTGGKTVAQWVQSVLAGETSQVGP